MAITMDLAARGNSRNRTDTVGNIGIGDYFLLIVHEVPPGLPLTVGSIARWIVRISIHLTLWFVFSMLPLGKFQNSVS